MGGEHEKRSWAWRTLNLVVMLSWQGSLTEIEVLVEQKVQARLQKADEAKDEEAVQLLLPILRMSSLLEPLLAKATSLEKQLIAQKSKEAFRGQMKVVFSKAASTVTADEMKKLQALAAKVEPEIAKELGECLPDMLDILMELVGGNSTDSCDLELLMNFVTECRQAASEQRVGGGVWKLHSAATGPGKLTSHYTVITGPLQDSSQVVGPSPIPR